MAMTDGLRVGGTVTLIAFKDGRPCHEISQRNLVVRAGKELVGDLLLNVPGCVGITFCALGTGIGTPTADGTSLVAEVTRSTVAVASRSGTVVTWESYFTKAQSAFVITEIGHFSGTASSELGSGSLFEWSTINFDNSGTVYDLSVLYQLSII